MIRTINTKEITKNVKEMCIEANHYLSPDMDAAMKKATAEEKSELGKKILNQLQENLKIAGEEMIPICQDTGMAVFFVEIGQDVHFEGDLIEDAINEGLLKVTKNDLNIYGRSTRPLYVALSYFSDVKLPTTNNQQEAKVVLEELGVDEKHNRKTLSEVTEEDKMEIKKFLSRMISKRVPPKYLKYVPKLIVGDAYTFLNEEEGSFLRDGSEFSTAMNACGRNRKEAIGVDIIKGDRLVALDALEEVSKTHKYNLATSISKVADNYHSEIIELDNFQYFDCSDFDEDIASNIIGTITGMVLGYCNWKKPILGFSKPKNNQIKVSLRCSKLLAYDGIHFGNMMREIAKEVGGTGGGHAIACGAYIPNEKKSEFLDKFNRKLQGKIAN